MGLAARLVRAEYEVGAKVSTRLAAPTPIDMMGALDLVPDEWQRAVLQSTARRMLLAVTRQGGKSTVASVKAVHKTLARPGALVIIVSPTQRQSAEVFRKCIETYRAAGHPIPAESETKLSLELVTGSRILSLPGSERSIRGYSAPDLIIVDEGAKVEDDLLYAVLPMMATNPASQLIAMSTPFGRRGWFSDFWHDAGDDWERHKITVHQVARITAEEIEAYRRIMPSWWFKSEFECEFMDAIDSVFSADDVDRALVDDLPPLFPMIGGMG
jgi:hypothetical protein